VSRHVGIPWSRPFAERLRAELEAGHPTAAVAARLGCSTGNLHSQLAKILGWTPPRRGARWQRADQWRAALRVLRAGGNYYDVCQRLQLPSTPRERERLRAGVRHYCNRLRLPYPAVPYARGPILPQSTRDVL